MRYRRRDDMNTVWDKAVKLLAAAGGAVAGAFGGWDKLLTVLMAMMAVDYVSGVLVGVLGRSEKTEYGGLCSKVGAKGLAKKGLMLLVVLVAALLDRAMGQGAVCHDAACWFYIANEGISVLENAGRMNVPVCKNLTQYLEQLKSKEEPQ